MEASPYRKRENDESSASSISTSAYACTICFKIFYSGKALGGHQNRHLIERSLKRSQPNILGAVLNHPLPGDDVHTLAAALRANADKPKTTLQLAPPPPPADSDPLALTLGHNLKAADHSQRVVADQIAKMESKTMNLFGEWKPVLEILKEENARAAAAAFALPAGDDDVDLELSLKIKGGDLDLNLKLGF